MLSGATAQYPRNDIPLLQSPKAKVLRTDTVIPGGRCVLRYLHHHRCIPKSASIGSFGNHGNSLLLIRFPQFLQYLLDQAKRHVLHPLDRMPPQPKLHGETTSAKHASQSLVVVRHRFRHCKNAPILFAAATLRYLLIIRLGRTQNRLHSPIGH